MTLGHLRMVLKQWLPACLGWGLLFFRLKLVVGWSIGVCRGPWKGSGFVIQGWVSMIILTRLNGPAFALNPDLIERAESTPDTVLTLVDGTKYVVAEALGELIARIRWFRASVIATAGAFDVSRLDPSPDAGAGSVAGSGSSTVVPLHRG